MDNSLVAGSNLRTVFKFTDADITVFETVSTNGRQIWVWTRKTSKF